MLLRNLISATRYVRTWRMSQPQVANMSTKSLVGVCQMRATNDKDRNYKICEGLVRKAKTGGAKMVFLPESFDYIGENAVESVNMAESMDGVTIQRYKSLARSEGVWLSLGGFHRKVPNDPTRILMSHVLLDDTGEILSTYDKAHLFDFEKLKESAHCKAGTELVEPVATPVGKIGLAICYDVRFVEMSLWLANRGAEILTFPSAFTVPTGEAHWHVSRTAEVLVGKEKQAEKTLVSAWCPPTQRENL